MLCINQRNRVILIDGSDADVEKTLDVRQLFAVIIE